MGELCLRHTEILCLAPRHRSVELRVAEERRAHALFFHAGRRTLGHESVVAELTCAAGDLEGDDDAVPDPEVAGVRTDLLDDTHRLMAEDVAGVHERAEYFVEV